MQPDRRISRSEASIKERYEMSPIEKHIYFNKAPYRLFLNIILLVLVTILVQSIYDEEAGPPREMNRLFQYIFIDAEDDESLIKSIYNIRNLKENINKVYQGLQNLETNLFQDIELDLANFSLISYPKYTDEYRENFTVPLNISEDLVYPLNISNSTSIKQYFNQVDRLVIAAENLILTTSINGVPDKCSNYSVYVIYDNNQLSLIEATVEFELFSCIGSFAIDSTYSNKEAVFWICLIVIGLSSISLILTYRQWAKIGGAFIDIRNYFLNKESRKENDVLTRNSEELMDETGHKIEDLTSLAQYNSWEDVPFKNKLRFFNGWYVWNTITNIFQMISCIVLLLIGTQRMSEDNVSFINFVLGIAVFMSWIQIVQYLEYWKSVVLMTTTLQSTSLRVFFMLYVPIFTGFSILGYSLFWMHSPFSDVGSSAKTLFAMSCGDNIHATFLAVWDQGILKQIFLIIFMLCFLTAAANIFYSLIQEGYDKSRLRKELKITTETRQIDDYDLFQGVDIREFTGEAGAPEIQHYLDFADLSETERNCISLLFFNMDQAKIKIKELNLLRNMVESKNIDAEYKKFLAELSYSEMNKVLKKIDYLKSNYKN